VRRIDLDVRSFDGTRIRAHWFPVKGASKAKPAPTILMGPGWSLPGDTSTSRSALFGAASIGGLGDAGYNVVTWDPRGFGASGGRVMVDDPAHEGRDVQVLLDWVAAQPVAQLDGKGDPRSGMVGLSYGGGIQLAVASQDCRVDALVPGLAWHSLSSSLLPQDTYKVGWNTFLTKIGSAAGKLDPHITEAAARASATGTVSDEDRRWFLDKGPGARIDRIDVPTLFVSGTVDTLFPLHETLENYASFTRRGVPAAMVWFCGGHGTCLTEAGEDRSEAATMAWLARYVKGDAGVRLPPALDLVDQDGIRWSAAEYPRTTDEVTARGSGSLVLTAESAAGPLTKPGDDLLGGLVAGFTPAKATKAVEVRIDPAQVDGLALGQPKLALTYSGKAPSAAGSGDANVPPDRIYAQLVDDDTGLVVGNQITPVPVKLDRAKHSVTVAMEVIAQHLRPGHTLTLQLVATTPGYFSPRLGGTIDLSSVRISLPVATGIRPAT